MMAVEKMRCISRLLLLVFLVVVTALAPVALFAEEPACLVWSNLRARYSNPLDVAPAVENTCDVAVFFPWTHPDFRPTFQRWSPGFQMWLPGVRHSFSCGSTNVAEKGFSLAPGESTTLVPDSAAFNAPPIEERPGENLYSVILEQPEEYERRERLALAASKTFAVDLEDFSLAEPASGLFRLTIVYALTPWSRSCTPDGVYLSNSGEFALELHK